MSRATSHARRATPWIRPLTAVTFVVLLAATVVTVLGIDRLADEQESRLHEERTSEVAVFLESSLTPVELAFPFMTALLQLTDDPVPPFELAAAQLLSGQVHGMALTEDVGGVHEPIALVGEGPPVGEPLDERWEALLARSAEEGGLVTGVLDSGGGGTTVGLASTPEGTPAILMVLQYDPPNAVQREPGGPFSDIDGAMFVGLEPDPATVVITTVDELPLTGDVAQASVTVGLDEWLVLTQSDSALVGPLADRTRWGVLVGGLALALLAAALMEILNRRRSYALRLVEERTAELRVARQVAEDANHSKSQFLSRMSHELRTPLNAVIGFGQLLELEQLDAQQRDSVEQILKGGRHLLDLINEVLDISRIEAGELALSPEAVPVGDLVQEAVELIRPLADQREIQLVVQRADPDESHLFADRQRTKQVLLNLLSNAVKYNRARGTVGVTFEAVDGVVRIDVTDTGPGIPAEQLGQLFTAFERLGAQHTGVEGTGIGLALARRLAEAMGGTVTVDSTLGKGSTFTVELPRVEDPVGRYERLSGPRDDEPAAPAAGQQATVIHIEDNLSNLKLVERILAQRPGVEVVPAMHGRLGIELAREHHPALVLLDLHLPDVGGEEVLRLLQEDPATASVPVVVVSADATAGQIQRLLDAGAMAYLTKPIDVPELLAVLDQVLAARS